MRLRAGSQWIVAARPLYHLQCPIVYLSRLQRIQSMDLTEFQSKEDPTTDTSSGPSPSACAHGNAFAHLLWVGTRSLSLSAASLAWILT